MYADFNWLYITPITVNNPAAIAAATTALSPFVNFDHLSLLP